MFRRIRAFFSSIVTFLIGLALIFALAYGIKSFFSKEEIHMPIYKVATDEMKIALTFDVSYGRKNIYDILEILDKYNIKATFFVVGSWIDKNEDLLKEIHKRGHEIGSHSNSHIDFANLSKAQIKEELILSSEKIKKAIREDVTLFRPPFGEIKYENVKLCEDLGYKVIKWDIDSLDWKHLSDYNLIDRLAKNTSQGSIIMFQCDGNDINTCLDKIIQHFKKNGYSMVRVSDLLYEKDYYIDSSGMQRLKKSNK